MEIVVLMEVRDTLLVVDKVENPLLVLVDMVEVVISIIVDRQALVVVQDLEMIVDLAVLAVVVLFLFVMLSR